MSASVGSGRRILFVVENLPVPFDRRVWNEATTLRAAGYEVSVICPKGFGARRSHEVIDGIHIWRHPLPLEAKGAAGYVVEYSWALAWEFLLTAWILVRRGFDVMHACNPPDLIFLVGRVFKLFGKKFVFDHHDINPELYIAKFGKKGWYYRLLLKLERWTFATADISIATNESYRQIAIERGGMAPEKVFVVRSGPNLTRMRIQAPEPRLKMGRAFLVGYVGVIGQQEGIDLLIEAVAHIVRTLGRTDVQFAVLGEGPARQACQELAAQRGVAEHMVFTGRVSDEVLLGYLNTADVCVNPDRVNAMNDKSTMNKIMEYMALGKPIVQFETTEGRVSAQGSALYAKPNDAIDFANKIVELLDQPERRARMGLIGRQRVVGELSWDNEAPNLVAAYDAVFRQPVAAGAPEN